MKHIINVKEINERRAVVEIITGVANMKGLNTTNKDIKDYRYLAVIARWKSIEKHMKDLA